MLPPEYQWQSIEKISIAHFKQETLKIETRLRVSQGAVCINPPILDQNILDVMIT